jgi:hypothetical protein
MATGPYSVIGSLNLQAAILIVACYKLRTRGTFVLIREDPCCKVARISRRTPAQWA